MKKDISKLIITAIVFGILLGGSSFIYNRYKNEAIADLDIIEETQSSKTTEIKDLEVADANVQLAPNFTLTNKYGSEVALSDYIGKKHVIINFWATWCGYCLEEMPLFERMQYKYKTDDVEFLMVNTTYSDDKDKANKYLSDNELYFDNILFDTDGIASSQYNIEALPTTFYIKKDGSVLAYTQGALNQERLEKAIAKLIEE